MAKYCVPNERNAVNHSTSLCALVVISAFAASAHANSERLLATGGVIQIEGSGGGGLNPWALITGLETNSEIGGSADCTYVRPQHFALTSCGIAAGILDRVELSYARQKFNLDDVAPGNAIRQDTVGAKLRVYGDAVYDQDRGFPQVSLGLQYKHNLDFDFIPRLIGAQHGAGLDVYLAVTKVFLAGPFGRTWLVDGNVRATRANQFGILGYGGDRSDAYSIVGEGSIAAFITDSVVAGVEYRQKPDKIQAFREEDAKDVFVAWFPIKYVSLTAAYVDLGNIATHSGQKGWYVALQGTL
jgi:hypothetical protein